jgi:hypothetical protein
LTDGKSINIIKTNNLFPPQTKIVAKKFTNSELIIDNFGKIGRGTAGPGTRETPASLLTKYIISIVLFLKINQSNISNRNLLF